jgi:hydroxypyruvate isomerase
MTDFSKPVTATSKAWTQNSIKGLIHGRIKPAMTLWCLRDASQEKWPLEKVCQVAKELKVPAIEVVAPSDFPVLKQYGLACALTTSHGYIRGMCNPMHWDECLPKIAASIEATAAYGFKNVISFQGFLDTSAEPSEEGGPGGVKGSRVTLEEGIRNCVEGYKKVVGLAEKKNVSLCIEALNTRDAAAMKGHPGYMADHLDICVDIIRRVGSPALKLVYDAYHIQIMDGDIIRRLREVKDVLGYVQLAGVPGRHEIDDTQEVNWAAFAQALLEIGYDGYVGLEFIPTRDARQSVSQAIQILDI